MPKARKPSTPPWLSQHDALKLALSSKRLLGFLAEAKPSDWRYAYAENVAPEQDLSDYWRSNPTIDGDTASRSEISPTEAAIVRGATLYGVQISAAYLKWRLNPTNTYIAAEVRQIIESGGPTTERPLAEEVHRRMTDNPAVKVLSVPHLRRKISRGVQIWWCKKSDRCVNFCTTCSSACLSF